MKKIKAINGYTIYEATEKDTKKYNVEAGCFYIYFSSDIRDYGLTNSDYDWEAGTIEEAISFSDSSNYAIAKELVEAKTTAASFEEIEEVEEMLNAGVSPLDIEELETLEDLHFMCEYDNYEIIENYNDNFKHFYLLASYSIDLELNEFGNIYIVENGCKKYLCTIRKGGLYNENIRQ